MFFSIVTGQGDVWMAHTLSLSSSSSELSSVTETSDDSSSPDSSLFFPSPALCLSNLPRGLAFLASGSAIGTVTRMINRTEYNLETENVCVYSPRAN